MINKLYFIGPMDLGDCFVYSGIVHHYADHCKELHVPVKASNYFTIKTLYQDRPNIKVIIMLPDDEEAYIKNYGLSKLMPPADLYIKTIDNVFCSILWDEQIYTIFDIPYSYRYSKFQTPLVNEGSEKLYDQLCKGDPYVLIHRQCSTYPDGIPIDVEKYREVYGLGHADIIEITPALSNNMMDYIKLIENAAEIHCISSSFFWLVDSIHQRVKGKLFFHDVRAASIERVNNRWNHYRWEIVPYPYRM